MPSKKPDPLVRARMAVVFASAAIVAVALLSMVFLVPFVVDPALASLAAGFNASPVTCTLRSVRVARRRSQCSWTSCSDGCTASITDCVQLRVDVTNVPYDQNKILGPDDVSSEWTPSQNVEHNSQTENGADNVTIMTDSPLLVNIRACVYPPHVDCRQYFATFRSEKRISPSDMGGISAEKAYRLNETFPCYVSSSIARLVVSEFSRETALIRLLLALFMPLLLAMLGAALLGCFRSKRMQQLFQTPPPRAEDDEEQTG